jgi:hypothetical protein
MLCPEAVRRRGPGVFVRVEAVDSTTVVAGGLGCLFGRGMYNGTKDSSGDEDLYLFPDKMAGDLRPYSPKSSLSNIS